MGKKEERRRRAREQALGLVKDFTNKSGSETAREPIVSNRLWNSTGNLPKQKYPQTNDVGSSTKHFKSMQRQLRKREKLLKQMARVEKSMKNAQENIMRKHGIKNKDLGKSTGGHTLPPSWRALDPEYLHRLNISYDKWISAITDCPVITIQTDNFNIFTDSIALQNIENQIVENI